MKAGSSPGGWSLQPAQERRGALDLSERARRRWGLADCLTSSSAAPKRGIFRGMVLSLLFSLERKCCREALALWFTFTYVVLIYPSPEYPTLGQRQVHLLECYGNNSSYLLQDL